MPEPRDTAAESSDPVDELEVGDTVKLQREFRTHLIDLVAADDFWGHDREVENFAVEDAHFEVDDGDDEWGEIVVSFSGDVTKQEVPAEVIERRQKRQERKEKREEWENSLTYRALRVGQVVIPFAIVIGVSVAVIEGITPMVIGTGAETKTYDPTVQQLLIEFAPIILLIAIAYWAVTGGIPRDIGGKL